MGTSAGDFVREIRAKQSPRWLTLWGRSGTGKTFLARSIHGMFPGKAHWLDWVDLCRRYQCKEDITGRLRWACDAALVVIDDAGAEHQTPATLALLHGLLQARIRRWTIITTNLSPDAWRQRDERIGSRIIRDGNTHADCSTLDFAAR